MNNLKYFTDKYTFLRIESEHLNSLINFINETNIENIALNKQWGYHLKDVSFIDSCAGIKRIVIVNNDININSLALLKNISFIQSDSDPTIPIDLLQIGKVEELRINDNKNWKNLTFVSTLLELSLYRIKNISLQIDNQWKSLKKLVLTQGKLETTIGIGNLGSLEELNLNILPKLKEIVFDDELLHLKKIKIEGCKKIELIKGIENLPALEEIIFLNCGKLNTISFLDPPPKNLEKITIKGTIVMDDSFNLIRKIKTYFYDGTKPIIQAK